MKKVTVCLITSCLFLLYLSGCKNDSGYQGKASGSISSQKLTYDENPLILWSTQQNGLALGIEKPGSSLIFEPIKDWKGPLIIQEDTPAGGSMRSNSGGHWAETAVLNIYIKNVTDKPIFWTRAGSAWHVFFHGPESSNPVEWPDSKPFWVGYDEPVRLDPGEQELVQFNISTAGDIWPVVPEGEYPVYVSYSPNHLLKFAVGGEGNLEHHFDISGFWKGEILTHTINIKVNYPDK